MTVADVLLRGKQAARRLAEIDTELQVRRARIGVQGHSFEATAKVGVLDPSRHIDALLDATAELEQEAASCHQDVAEADRLCRGIEREVNVLLGECLRMYFVESRSVRTIASRLHMERHLVEAMVSRDTLADIGRHTPLARLMADNG